MSQYAILGASGHGKVVADALIQMLDEKNIIFFDDRFPSIQSIEFWPVQGTTQDLINRRNEFDGVIVAIGNNSIRYLKQNELVASGVKIFSVIHPKAVISSFAKIGLGSVVLAGAVINAFSEVGEACIINTNCVVEHDCKISNAVHISPSVSLAGTVEIGQCTWIGIGSCVKQMVQIGEQVIVGAGSVVIRNIDNGLTVVGSPAKLIK